MTNSTQHSQSSRLSVSKCLRRPRRELTSRELATLRLVADTLIPATGDYPSGGGVGNFATMMFQAFGILDARFEQLTGVLEELANDAAPTLWSRLRIMSTERSDDFYWLSTVVAAVYLHAPEVSHKIDYPVPHPNPIDLFEVADEISSAILDPVVARGDIYVTAE
jgi:hypothetical protein